MVDPCSNQPISSPLRRGASQEMAPAARRPSCRRTSTKRSRIPATSTAATGTRVTTWPGRREPDPEDRPLVLAIEARDAPERTRVDVPGVAWDVGNLLDAAVVRGMEAVIHACGEPERHVATVPVPVGERRIDKQLLEGVGETLRLDQRGAIDLTGRADDPVARADEHGGVRVDRPCARRELAGEAVVQAPERGSARVAQVHVREQAPDPDREVSHERLLDPAEPADEPGREPSRDAVGQQEVEIFLLEHRGEARADGH